MLRGNRYRIYPDTEQKALMEKHFGSCRFVYNKLLEIKSLLYKKFRMSISEFELNNHLQILKEVYPWLKEVNAGALQQASRNEQSFYKFFSTLDLGILKRKRKRITIFPFRFLNTIVLIVLFPKFCCLSLVGLRLRCIGKLAKEV